MHLAESSLDGHIHGSKVGMGGHDPDNAAGSRVKTRSNNSQDDILAGKDTRDGTLILNQERSCVVLLHQRSSLLDRGPNTDSGRGNSGQDGLESRPGHLGAESLNVLDNLLRLAGAKLGLNTLKSII